MRELASAVRGSASVFSDLMNWPVPLTATLTLIGGAVLIVGWMMSRDIERGQPTSVAVLAHSDDDYVHEYMRHVHRRSCKSAYDCGGSGEK